MWKRKCGSCDHLPCWGLSDPSGSAFRFCGPELGMRTVFRTAMTGLLPSKLFNLKGLQDGTHMLYQLGASQKDDLCPE